MTTAEKIYSASTDEDADQARLAERLARQIEDDIASKGVPVGGVMGSLRDLSERYGVGRAAVREGVALLERRGLGRLRPGPCGGFIVAQPDADSIGAELANYFRMAGISSQHLLDARDAVDLMVAAMAATNRARSEQEALQFTPAGESPDSLGWHLRTRIDLAGFSDEPALGLFVTCLNDLTEEFASPREAQNDWQKRAELSAAQLTSAVIAGQPEVAMTAMQALNDDLKSRLSAKTHPIAAPITTDERHEDDRTLANLVARRFAAEILRTGSAGQRLGSEWDLCERFSVSRATLRRAIRQLQDSGLVECRRGRGNGLIVRDLRGTGTIRLVLAFLISHQMNPKAAGTILFQLNRFIPALAVLRANEQERGELEALLARARRKDTIDRYELLRLVQCVSRLGDSPIIDLFSRCLAAYEARFHPVLAERLPASMQIEYFDLLRLLLDNVDPGDDAKMEWAKRESSKVMLLMSHSRPI